MKTKVVLVSIFSVCMLLMVSSISALQIKKNIIKQTENIELGYDFPLLHIFVLTVLLLRAGRTAFWAYLAAILSDSLFSYNEDLFAYQRSLFLYKKTIFWLKLWEPFGERAGWW